MVMYKENVNGRISSRSFGRQFGGEGVSEEEARTFLIDLMAELDGYRLMTMRLQTEFFDEVLDQKVALMIQSNEFDFEDAGMYEAIDDFIDNNKLPDSVANELEKRFFQEVKKNYKRFMTVKFDKTKLRAMVQSNFKRLMISDSRHIKMAQITLEGIMPFRLGSVTNGRNQESIKLLFNRIFEHVADELKGMILDKIFEIPNSVDIKVDEENIFDTLNELYQDIERED